MTDDELLLALSEIMDKKIQPLDSKIDAVEQSLSRKIDLLDNKIDIVQQNLTASDSSY